MSNKLVRVSISNTKVHVSGSKALRSVMVGEYFPEAAEFKEPHVWSKEIEITSDEAKLAFQLRAENDEDFVNNYEELNSRTPSELKADAKRKLAEAEEANRLAEEAEKAEAEKAEAEETETEDSEEVESSVEEETEKDAEVETEAETVGDSKEEVDLEDMKKSELVDLALEKGLIPKGNLKKEELIELIKGA